MFQWATALILGSNTADAEQGLEKVESRVRNSRERAIRVSIESSVKQHMQNATDGGVHSVVAERKRRMKKVSGDGHKT